MKKVNLTISGRFKSTPEVFVDDKPINLVKNPHGNYSATIEAENPFIALTVNKMHELSGNLSWLFMFISFVVSLFGILSPRYKRDYIVCQSRFKVNIEQDTNIDINLDTKDKKQQKVIIITEADYIEEQNICYIDKSARLKKKLFTAFKVLFTIGLFIVIGIILNTIYKNTF